MQQDLIAIGDIQGCLESLQGLITQLPETAPLVFVGDLVNRGPQSLETLRFIRDLSLQGRARVVLGNHDLHLLAVAAGAGRIHPKDTIAPILHAPDADELLDWLRLQPLIIDTPDVVFVHAGIPPSWSLNTALALAQEAQDALSGKNWKNYLQEMYGNDNYKEGNQGASRMRSILNGLTRMRFVDPRGNLDFSLKEGLESAPKGYRPWFEAPAKVNKLICFGHWSMLGLLLRPKHIAIDTGCLWGGRLTAIRLRDRRIWEEICPMWAAPGC